MRAVCWYGKHDVRVTSVDDPRILNPRDAIIRVTLTAICGSDLHLYDGMIPTMVEGDILGHEAVGEVVELGPEVHNLSVGDRVVVPFTIACGRCLFCEKQLWALCDNSNPNAGLAERLYGYSPGGLFGYSHMMGGYAGAQAEYLRVPFADVGPMLLPEHIPDEQAVCLADILPTGWMAAENCGIEKGDTIAVWGCGPVGQCAIRCARVTGAGRVIAIDNVQERLDMAREGGAEPVNFDGVELLDALHEMTAGRGPDACIDAVGLEAHGAAPGMLHDWAKTATRMASDRPNVLRQAIQACRKGGVVSIPGVYGGLLDKLPFGAAFAKGLTLKMGQTHVHRYLKPLLEKIESLDPGFVITHRAPLSDAPLAYEMFKHKRDGCVKVVLDPAA